MNTFFRIIVLSRNNENWVETNISSILCQTYKNYEVIYHNDGSTDNTKSEVETHVNGNLRFKIIHSTERKSKSGFFKSLDTTSFNDNDVLVFVDGDDWFAHENVLSYLNETYDSTGCWMTYGGMGVWDGGEEVKEPFPQNSEFSQQVREQKLYRRDLWRSSHLKSMKVFVWNRIDKNDFVSKKDGSFIVPDDLVFMFAALEMCPPQKVYRLTDTSYVYNGVILNGGTQKANNVNMEHELEVRTRTPYSTIGIVSSNFYGGLGNLMFEMAAAVAVAKKNNAVAMFSPQRHCLPKQGRNVNNYTDNILKNFIWNINLSFSKQYEEASNELPVPYVNNLLMNGHFQKLKYLAGAEKELKAMFNDGSIVAEIKKKYPHINFDEMTSLHMRRGDYLEAPKTHPVPSLEYYNEAVNKIGNINTLLVFSDGIDWCKANLKFKYPMVFFTDIDYVEMLAMSLCKNNIIGNSTFSWWSAWLNEHEDKKVVAPKQWFGPAIPDFDVHDIVPDNWILL